MHSLTLLGSRAFALDVGCQAHLRWIDSDRLEMLSDWFKLIVFEHFAQQTFLRNPALGILGIGSATLALGARVCLGGLYPSLPGGWSTHKQMFRTHGFIGSSLVCDGTS